MHSCVPGDDARLVPLSASTGERFRRYPLQSDWRGAGGEAGGGVELLRPANLLQLRVLRRGVDDELGRAALPRSRNLGGAATTALPHVTVLSGVCLEIARGAATRNFGCGQGGETGASPQRAVTVEPTQATGKRTVALRVFAERAVWLRCSSVTDRWRVCSLVAPRHPTLSAKNSAPWSFQTDS